MPPYPMFAGYSFYLPTKGWRAESTLVRYWTQDPLHKNLWKHFHFQTWDKKLWKAMLIERNTKQLQANSLWCLVFHTIHQLIFFKFLWLCFQTVLLLKNEMWTHKVILHNYLLTCSELKEAALGRTARSTMLFFSFDESFNQECQQEQMDFIVKYFKAD